MLAAIQATESELDFNTIKNTAHILRAVNNKVRQEIVKFIYNNSPTDVTSIYANLRLQQSVSSQHLAILRSAKIVKAERVGRNILYSLNTDRISDVVKFINNVTSPAKSTKSRIVYSKIEVGELQ